MKEKTKSKRTQMKYNVLVVIKSMQNEKSSTCCQRNVAWSVE